MGCYVLLCRLHYVKRISMQKKRDVALLKSRLDVYNDEWRTAQPDPDSKVKLPFISVQTGKVRKPRVRKADREFVQTEANAGNAKDPENLSAVPLSGQKGLTKRKRSKSDKVCILCLTISYIYVEGAETELICY